MDKYLSKPKKKLNSTPVYSDYTPRLTTGIGAQLWTYFLREKEGQLAKCKRCDAIIKASNGSTGGLRHHLHGIHKLHMDAETETSSESPPSKIQKITSFFESKTDNSIDAIVSRMTALDGLTFSVFVTSVDLRECFKQRGLILPSSKSSIKNMVVKYSKKIQNLQLQEIQSLIKSGSKFSVSFDEWTSVRNRRYINVNLHSSKKFWNLGLVRAKGYLPAEKCLSLVESKLQKYGVSLNTDVVSIVTDGPNVMKKVGRLSPTFQQLCFVHGIHLGVTDVLYAKNNQKDAETDALIDMDEDSNHGEEVIDESDDENGLDFLNENQSHELTHPIYLPLIDKVRRVVRLFRKSATRNDAVLQKHVVNDTDKEKQLILDSKTRWSSLYLMIERFLLLINSIKKALIDLNSPYAFSEEEIDNLRSMKSALEPIKVCVDALCRRESSLFTADTILKFMFSKLLQQNSCLSKDLFKALAERVRDRRTEMSILLSYLEKGKNEDDHSDQEIKSVFLSVPPSRIPKLLKDIVERLYVSNSLPTIASTTQEIIQGDLDTSIQNQKKKSSVEDELQCAIQASIDNSRLPSTSRAPNLLTTIKREIALFESGGGRGHHLSLVYQSLLSVPPTSVEAERAFSSAGYICPKIRSNLEDDSLDSLCFLRAYFKSISADDRAKK